LQPDNIYLFIRKLHNQQEVDLTDLFLVLSNGDESGWTMTLISGKHGIKGQITNCGHETLHGLKLHIEDSNGNLLREMDEMGGQCNG
jgi:hypothetical protein